MNTSNATLTPITYEWNIGGNIVFEEKPNYTIPGSATTIIVTAIDGTGCIATESIYITPTATSISNPTFSISPSTPQCAGTPLTFTANNPSSSFNYFWVDFL